MKRYHRHSGATVRPNATVMDYFLSQAPDPTSLLPSSCIAQQKTPYIPTAAAHFNPESLQQRLLALMEGAHERWTYAIFWNSSVIDYGGPSVLGWGDNYYKGEDEKDKRRTTSSPLDPGPYFSNREIPARLDQKHHVALLIRKSLVSSLNDDVLSIGG